MPWNLEIHHLDVDSPGDSTIIIAKFDDGDPTHRIVRSVLIDGGDDTAAPIVRKRIKDLGIAKVDVVVVTHFDRDHFYGIHELVKANGSPLDQAIFYDQGRQPPAWEVDRVGIGKRTRDQSPCARYRDLVRNQHATRTVNSFQIASFNTTTGAITPPADQMLIYDDQGPPELYRSPAWLVGRDVMWGTLGPAGWSVLPVPPHAPGRPTLVCIAANKWVRQADGSAAFCSSEASTYPEKVFWQGFHESKKPNPKCLGFELTFNNFRYYTAGDVEIAQENGFFNQNTGSFADGIAAYLNPGSKMTARIHAMKVSHHGSDTATSENFLAVIRPAAAVVSCSRSNKFDHPHMGRVNALDGYPSNARARTSANPAHDRQLHRPPPPPPLRSPVIHYLTGYQHTQHPYSRGGDASYTAGDPATGDLGHVAILVSEAQSLRPGAARKYRVIRAAVGVAVTFVKGNLDEGDLDDYADVAASYGPVHVVAAALSVPIDTADAVLASLGDASAPALDEPDIVWYIGQNPTVDTDDVFDVFGDARADIGQAVLAGVIAAVTDDSDDLPAAVSNAILAMPGADKDKADAAESALHTLMTWTAAAADPVARGWAVLAACRAVGKKVSVGNAAVLGAVIGASSSGLNAVDVAAVVTAAIRKIGGDQTAAVVGAAAGTCLDLQAVGPATQQALDSAGVRYMDAIRGGALAETYAVLDPNSQDGDESMFDVEYEGLNGPLANAHSG